MPKSSSVVELKPSAASTSRASKPRKRRAAGALTAPQGPALAASSSMKPLLIGIGIGVGAAVAATALALRAPARPRRASALSAGLQPSIAGTLAKAALLGLARVVVQRAVGRMANRAALKVADAWSI